MLGNRELKAQKFEPKETFLRQSFHPALKEYMWVTLTIQDRIYISKKDLLKL